MYRSLTFPFASFLLFQAAVSEWPVCDAATLMTSLSCDTSSLVQPSGTPTFDGVARQSSVMSATSTPQTSHHHVGIIVGACLGAAGAVLVGLVLFWLFLRHRRPTETAEVQDMGPRSWAPRDFLGCHGVVVIANHRSRSIDLAGADTDTASVAPVSDETSETKQWNKPAEVLDISVENAPQSPPPSLPLPEPEPVEHSNPVPLLCIHTDVQADLSPSSSHSSTPAGLSRSSIRPLPTPPTGPQVRRHRSAKAEEAHRESDQRRLPHRKISADDVQVYVPKSRQSTAHSENSMGCEADGCVTPSLQHHNGGMDAWTDFPPPYSER